MEPTLDDRVEAIRRVLRVQINSNPAEREDLEIRYGRVWNAKEMADEFTVLEFKAPLVVVRRKIDNQLGSLFFQHWPRYDFEFGGDT